MVLFNITTIPYTLGASWNTVNAKLKYVGTYYYERFEVYEITDKPIAKLFNHLIEKVELIQFDKIIIGIIIYLRDDVTQIEKLKFDIDKNLKVEGILVSSNKSLSYRWIKHKEKLELVNETNSVVFKYCLKEFEV